MTSLETVKRYLRINGSGEDALLTSLSSAAKRYLLNAGVKPPIPPTDLPFATVEFGEGEHGVVTVTAPVAGIEGDGYSVQILEAEEVGEGEEAELTATLDDKLITVTLAEGGNTALGIAGAIAELGFEASASGEGTGTFTEAMSAIQFSGGETEAENTYLQEQALYDTAVSLYVDKLYDGADNKALEAAMTSIILQIKDYGGVT